MATTNVASLGALGVAMLKFSGKIKEARVQVIQTVIMSVVREEAAATPVDTGEARSNWLIDRPNESIPPHAPGQYLGRAETANLNATVQEALQDLQRAKYDEGSVIMLRNNIEYMQLLIERGTSRQAPVNFDETALDRGLSRARQPVAQVLVRILGGP